MATTTTTNGPPPPDLTGMLSEETRSAYNHAMLVHLKQQDELARLQRALADEKLKTAALQVEVEALRMQRIEDETRVMNAVGDRDVAVAERAAWEALFANVCNMLRGFNLPAPMVALLPVSREQRTVAERMVDWLDISAEEEREPAKRSVLNDVSALLAQLAGVKRTPRTSQAAPGGAAEAKGGDSRAGGQG